MVIMLVMKNDRSVTWPTMAVIPMARRIEASAMISGMAAVTMAPKTRTRMIRAIPTPNISPLRRSLSAVAPKSLLMLASPVTRTSKSEGAVASRAAAVSVLASSVAVAADWAMVKTRSAACRSADTSTGDGSVV